MADDPEEKEAPVKALDEDDIALLKTYGLGPYATRIKAREKDLQDVAKRVNEISGLKESDSGLAPPSRWDIASDKQAMQEEQPLQVGHNEANCSTNFVNDHDACEAALKCHEE